MRVTRDEILKTARRIEAAIDDQNEGEEADAELIMAAEVASTVLSKLAGEGDPDDAPSAEEQLAVARQLIDDLFTLLTALLDAVEEDLDGRPPSDDHSAKLLELVATAKHKLANVKDARAS
jgi:hypothetical protein